MVTMQDVLLRLTDFWASRGCVIAQPMNTEVGAGTLNPATFLRVLGPEPWRVAYVEPSVRPDDSRYGENPNRLQMYDQYQVILKPEPGDTQQLYLDSLCALGIDIRRHDVRFVEDDWAQPAIGAWGLGWEVWLDGLEITQFTYFQQAGGIYLDPVAVEITYGVERIVMALQGVTHFKDITYAPGITYGEAFGQAEYEMSRYYLDVADIQANRALFDLYLGEARRLLELRLPVPAYSYILKCSQTFNVLDARGAIGTTERARTFAAMRQLAHQVAELWTERRAELGHPLGSAQTRAADVAPPASLPEITAPATLALEIGVEEMPAGEVNRAAGAVGAALAERLAATRLGHGDVRVFATPRRIGAVVDAVEPREADSEELLRGPRASAAFDAEGRPTPAATGFARKQGVEVGDLQRVTVEGTAYVAAVKQTRGRSAAEVVASILPELVTSLRAEKNMRWNAPGLSFTRPIRSLVCLLGDEVVPVRVSNLDTGRVTRIMLTKAGGLVEVASADRYLPSLAEQGVTPDFQDRRQAILEQAEALAREGDGVIDPDEESALLYEVANLCEHPVAVAGHFDTRYLELPPEVLTTVMKKHQRYLPVRDADGALLPRFVAIADGPCDPDVVRAGNESVLRARYEDALFFWKHDLGTPLERMKEKLALLTFEERLGSMLDHSKRIAAIATKLGQHVGLDPAQRETLARAAELAKFDLGSQMVMELTSLAGVMADVYARRAGERPEVAHALFDMEHPLPGSLLGSLLALADRGDLLAGMFAIGAQPTGSSDPFGLRRAAVSVNAILSQEWFKDAPVTVTGLLIDAGRQQPVDLTGAALGEASDFLLKRFEQSLLDAGFRFDVVQAVLQPHGNRPWQAQAAARSLTRIIDTEEFHRLATAIQRVIRIWEGTGAGPVYDSALFQAPAEHDLANALVAVRAELGDSFNLPESFCTVTEQLVAPIDQFFEREENGGVLVMAPDPRIQANRLGLLGTITEVAMLALDWRAVK